MSADVTLESYKNQARNTSPEWCLSISNASQSQASQASISSISKTTWLHLVTSLLDIHCCSFQGWLWPSQACSSLWLQLISFIGPINSSCYNIVASAPNSTECTSPFFFFFSSWYILLQKSKSLLWDLVISYTSVNFCLNPCCLV